MSQNTPPVLKLSHSFSSYGFSDTMEVEKWLWSGGVQPSDESIKNGFHVLYDQIYTKGPNNKVYWTFNYHFTEEQKQRWEVMESITGLTPILKEYEIATEIMNESHKSFMVMAKYVTE